MIDNYDSFTYNLVQYLRELGYEVVVKRNDELTIPQIEEINPEVIIISPGPCSPLEAGISISVVEYFKDKKPILGICLGHQTIGHVFGAEIIEAIRPVHGKAGPINHNRQGIFKDLNNPLEVTRYHSLVINPGTLSDELEVTARTNEGEIMGIKHKDYLIEGVQFHPEAILTEQGHQLLDNFIKQARGE